MDYIAGSFYDGFVLYAMALEETLAEGGAQNDGISITMKMQNRRMWGELILGCVRNFDMISCTGEVFTDFMFFFTWGLQKRFKRSPNSHGCLGTITEARWDI